MKITTIRIIVIGKYGWLNRRHFTSYLPGTHNIIIKVKRLQNLRCHLTFSGKELTIDDFREGA